jgi:hypothetical protein
MALLESATYWLHGMQPGTVYGRTYRNWQFGPDVNNNKRVAKSSGDNSGVQSPHCIVRVELLTPMITTRFYEQIKVKLQEFGLRFWP